MTVQEIMRADLRRAISQFCLWEAYRNMDNVMTWDATVDPQRPAWVLLSDGDMYSIHPSWADFSTDSALDDDELLNMGYDTINWHHLPNRSPLRIERAKQWA